jgi:hypothetical protein
LLTDDISKLRVKARGAGNLYSNEAMYGSIPLSTTGIQTNAPPPQLMQPMYMYAAGVNPSDLQQMHMAGGMNMAWGNNMQAPNIFPFDPRMAGYQMAQFPPQMQGGPGYPAYPPGGISTQGAGYDPAFVPAGPQQMGGPPSQYLLGGNSNASLQDPKPEANTVSEGEKEEGSSGEPTA